MAGRTNVSSSLQAIPTSLPTYYCLCGEYIVVGNVNIATLARRPADDSFVLRNIASEGQGAKHIYKLNAKSEKDAVFVQREQDEGGKPVYEKVWRKRCNRCDLFVAYETTDPRDKRIGDYTFLLAGSLSPLQSAVPPGAFGDETATATTSMEE